MATRNIRSPRDLWRNETRPQKGCCKSIVLAQGKGGFQAASVHNRPSTLVITLEWKRSPIHVAVYGSEPRLGFADFRLPPELLEGADDDKGLVVELQLAGLAQTYAFEQVTGTNDPSNVIDLEKEVALGVDSSSAHEDNVESETDMTEHDHENVKVGEDMGVYSGRKFVTLVSYCLAGEKKNSVKSAMQA